MDWIREASTSAGRADTVFFATVLLSTVFLAFITALMIGFVLRYDRRRHPRAAQIEGNALLELTWTLVPLVLFLVIFYYGWTRYDDTRNPPRDALAVRVTARQWNWVFTYPNGRRTTTLYAPVQRPMKLELTSADVIHGFYVPAFRLKGDCVPGRANRTWFQATRPGEYDLLCTVICGADHSSMVGQVVVLPEAEFRAWYFAAEGPEDSPPGLAVLRARGCLRCHSVDGRPMVGPTFKGVYGRREEVLAGDRARGITVDEARLRRAITDPGRERVQGYPPVMPRVELAPGELGQVLDYLRTLDPCGAP